MIISGYYKENEHLKENEPSYLGEFIFINWIIFVMAIWMNEWMNIGYISG